MESFIIQYIDSLRIFVYVAIFIGMILEGEGVIFVSIFLVHQGHLNLFVLVPIIFAGGITGDLFWFKFGGAVSQRFPRFHGKISKISRPIDHFLGARPFYTLLISKFAYGLNKFTITRAGSIGTMTLRSFLTANIPVIIIWAFTVSALGMAFSESFNTLKHYFKYAEIGILVGVLCLFGITHLITKLAMKKMETA